MLNPKGNFQELRWSICTPSATQGRGRTDITGICPTTPALPQAEDPPAFPPSHLASPHLTLRLSWDCFSPGAADRRNVAHQGCLDKARRGDYRELPDGKPALPPAPRLVRGSVRENWTQEGSKLQFPKRIKVLMLHEW